MAVNNLTPPDKYPQRGQDPSLFTDNANYFVKWQAETFVPEMNNVINDMNVLQSDVTNKWAAVMNQAVDGGYSQSYLDTKYNPPMKRTYYVDQVNGDDNNNGSSSYPFKTLKKAIDSVPVGGYGVIYLLSDYDRDNDREIIEILSKTIYLSVRATINVRYIVARNYSLANLVFHLKFSTLQISLESSVGAYLGRLIINDRDDISKPFHPSSYLVVNYGSPSNLEIRLRTREDNTHQLIVDDGILFNCYRWSNDGSFSTFSLNGHYSGNNRYAIVDIGNGAKLVDVNKAPMAIKIETSTNIHDGSGNRITNPADLIAGFYSDANGNPIGILFNKNSI